MARLTTRLPDGSYAVPADTLRACEQGVCGAAADKLGRFEDLHGELLAQQEEIAAKIEELRAAGKKNSVKFRELLGRKMMNNNILTLLNVRDLL